MAAAHTLARLYTSCQNEITQRLGFNAAITEIRGNQIIGRRVGRRVCPSVAGVHVIRHPCCRPGGGTATAHNTP